MKLQITFFHWYLRTRNPEIDYLYPDLLISHFSIIQGKIHLNIIEEKSQQFSNYTIYKAPRNYCIKYPQGSNKFLTGPYNADKVH